MPWPSHTTMPSGAASSSARKGTFHSRSIVDPDAEGGSRRGVLDPDPPAMRLHGGLAERQAETPVAPGRSFLAGHEPLEHTLADRFRNARPRIDHLELDTACHRLRTDPDGRTARCMSDRILD